MSRACLTMPVPPAGFTRAGWCSPKRRSKGPWIICSPKSSRCSRTWPARSPTSASSPSGPQLDEEETFPWDIMADLAQADLCGTIIPEAYGGLELGCLENCLVLEALAEGCVGVATTYAASFSGGLSPAAVRHRRAEAPVSAAPGPGRGPGRLCPDRTPGRQRRRRHRRPPR